MIVMILKALASYYFKKHGTELIFDAVIEAAEKSADFTATELDNDSVAKFKSDKPALMKIIRAAL